MSQATTNYISALCQAGYADADTDTLLQVIETRTKFVTMYRLGGGELLVGVFIKATSTKGGDYTGCPEYDGFDEDEALKAFLTAAAR